MNYNLNNKKILITGASGGIGSSICQKFIENNCTIICTACGGLSGSVNSLLNGFHREVGVSAIDNLEKSNLRVTCKIDILSTIGYKLH